MTKLDRSVLMQQNILRKLPAISLRLIPFLAARTDLDGRIHVTVGEIENAEIMSKKVVKDALFKLEEVNWIYRGKDNYYYSNFNIISESDRKDYHYINLFKFLTDKNFIGKLYKRQLIFLYYILTAKMPGTEHGIAIEHLYKNQTNKQNVKLPFFISFEDMVKSLVQLIERGLFEVRLGSSKQYLNKDTKSLKEKIYAYAGKNGKARKQRMSIKEVNNKLVHIRISRNLVSEDQKTDIYDVTRLSTLLDLNSIAMKFGCSMDHYQKDLFKKIHATKEGLYKELGSIGIQVYRESLTDFFENQSHSFEKLMNSGEFPNTLKNFYIIPRIQQKLELFINEVKTDCIKRMNEFPYEEFNHDLATDILEKSSSFISYFKDKAYFDNLVLLDHQLKKADIDLYNSILKLNRNWYLFKEKVEKIYQFEKEACGNDRSQVLGLAKQGMLTKNVRQSEDTKNNKQKNEQRIVYKDVAFDWLEG